MTNRIEVTMPYSEVCIHMRIAGKRMLVEPLPRGMAQVFTLDGEPFSFPITRGEAGVPYDDETVKFSTLHEDGTVTIEREIAQSDIRACSHVIMILEHYRPDGSCRCDDSTHTEMAEWEYKWNDNTQKWE